MIFGAFSCQMPQRVAHRDRSYTAAFLAKATSLPPKITAFTSSLNEPASIRFIQSTRADTKLLSVAPVKRSSIYCGVRPSGPPDEPAGKERKALCTCVFETCTSRKRLLPRGSRHRATHEATAAVASWVARCPPVSRRPRMFGFKRLQRFMCIGCWCVFGADNPNSCHEITGLDFAGNCRSKPTGVGHPFSRAVDSLLCGISL